jgi:hypothetical protein
MRTALVPFVALLTLPCTVAYGQTTPLATGNRVQVTSPAHRADKVVGTVLAIQNDTLVLQVEKITDPVRLPFSAITKIQVSRGQRRRVGDGLIMGGAIGAGVGMLLGFAAGDDDPGILAMSAGDKAAIGAVLLGVAGAGLGGLLGARSTKERWEPVPLGGVAARIGMAPRGDGVALRLSARF